MCIKTALKIKQLSEQLTVYGAHRGVLKAEKCSIRSQHAVSDDYWLRTTCTVRCRSRNQPLPSRSSYWLQPSPVSSSPGMHYSLVTLATFRLIY